MKITSMIILGLWSLTALAQADVTDILFDRNASFEEKQKVAQELAEDSDAPLDTLEAVAEVCYEIDLCASGSSQAVVDQACPGSDFKSILTIPMLGQSCYPKYFRTYKSCNPEIEKQTIKSTAIMSTMLDDYGTLYNNMTLAPMLEYMSKKIGTNLCDLKDNHGEAQKFMINNPDFLQKFLKQRNYSTAMGQYTQNCYEKINPMLFKNDKKKLKRYFNLFLGVIGSMEMFPEHKGKVNRGVSLPQEVLAEYHKVGNIVCSKGFTSTAVHDPSDYGDNPRNSFLGNKCSQRLYINYEENGAVPGKLIDSGSALKGENEVLFEPGACFRIDKVTPRTDVGTNPEEEAETCEENQRFNFEMTLVSK